MSAVEEKEVKGWKQLKALDHINNLPEGGTFQELTALVARDCFPETFTEKWIEKTVRSKHPLAENSFIQNRAERLREGKARHLVRYLYKHQDIPDPQSGKKQTLRAQGRIILPGKEVIIRESLSSVVETDSETGKNVVRAGTAKPKRAEAVKLPENQKVKAPMTEDRLAMFRKASAAVKAKNATNEMARLAKEGAHRFKGTAIPKRDSHETIIERDSEAV